MASKYDALPHYLNGIGVRSWRGTFTEIETILGFKLPASARRWNAWWANEAEPTTHVQKKAWLAHGWITQQVDLKG